jgi:hypothetical protein
MIPRKRIRCSWFVSMPRTRRHPEWPSLLETSGPFLHLPDANQQEVTDQLGHQVRRAVEVLIQSLDRADQHRQRDLLRGVSEGQLYEAALTVMMRLVFLFCAEERELLPLGNPVYGRHYAVSTLREQLQHSASRDGEEILERRHDSWRRLLAAFRAIHGGVQQDELKLPAYGGRLFDPNRFPFLEGRKSGTSWRTTDAAPPAINNRTVLHLLESLQSVETRLSNDRPVRRRLGFRSLDIEQIGHVYERLLDDSTRRASGAHYTPRSLTEPLVESTLAPLVYAGPVEGLPRSEWKLKPAKELLELKICDLACGSGAFLVQACRYLAERVQEAWQEQPLEDDHRPIEALRLVAQRCLYGVDKDPLAVEITRMSLWLLTRAGDRPFEFLDHTIRCGDSLVGILDLKQLERFNLAGEGMSQSLFLGNRISEAVELRRRIAQRAADTVAQVEEQQRLLAQAEDKLERLKLAADLLLAAELVEGNVAVHFQDDLERFRGEARQALSGRQAFHWPLEFPEVFARGGFDAVIGNPPWGQKVIDADPLLRAFLQRYYPSCRGIFDWFRPFTEQATRLVRNKGAVGLILPDILLLKNYPSTRKHLLDTMQLRLLSWHPMPFAGAVIDAVALSGWVTADEPKQPLTVRRFSSGEVTETSVPQDDFRRPPGYEFNLHLTPDRKTLLASLTRYPALGAFFEAHEGVHSGNIRADLFLSRRADESCRELYFGREEIRPHHLVWAGRFIRLSALPAGRPGQRYANAGRPEWYSRPKVLVRRTGDFVLAAADESGRYASNNFFVVLPCAAGSLDIYGLAALLNSRFMTWYYRGIVPRQGRAFAELKIKHLLTFPLPRQVNVPNGCATLNEIGRRRAGAQGDSTAPLDEAIGRLVDALFDINGWNEAGEPRGATGMTGGV